MDLLLSIFCGAGAAAYAYTRVGRRIGYGDTRSVVKAMAMIFVIVAVIFFITIRYVLHQN